MKTTPRVCRLATLVVVLLSSAPLGADAQHFVCWPITRGDTAYSLAVRLTGQAATLYSEWFQIRDPARGLFVPKSQYERLSTRWEACVRRDLVSRAALAVSSVPSPPGPATYNMTIVWRVGVTVTLVLFACSIAASYLPGRAIPADLQCAGERFVAAFARPLIDPACDAPPIRARLRFVRDRQQLEVCIAPNAGRRYPNLSDHKTNVEYDVKRVAQLMGAYEVASDRLRAEGQWVVVPVRRANLKQAGAK